MHFGGPVTYTWRGAAALERDAVCTRCARALAAAREPLLAALFGSHGGHAGGLGARQAALVGGALRRLPAAPLLVRCLRADHRLRPRRFDTALVRHQLRTQGIVEMAALRRAGWSETLCARELVARYGLLGGPSWRAIDQTWVADAARSARALLPRLPRLLAADLTVGRSKVFVRSPRTMWELEAARAERVEQLVRCVQRAWRRRLRRRHAAQAAIAAAWRHHRAEVRRRMPSAEAAVRVIWRAWSTWARRCYLMDLRARLGADTLSPLAPWPRLTPQLPALLGAADRALCRLYHAWRCRRFRDAVPQHRRNRMREKVTASALFRGRKALYPLTVPHPFVGDYVRLRSSLAWRRHHPADHYVVFADVVLLITKKIRHELTFLLAVIGECKSTASAEHDCCVKALQLLKAYQKTNQLWSLFHFLGLLIATLC
ncbi:hypothetical protein ACJJTC_016806 [Scirpophaga incertulas]